tara:strand:+ start:68 stop:394 length:327 start_codon:yes stop_codon:yes gene_type:complete
MCQSRLLHEIQCWQQLSQYVIKYRQKKLPEVLSPFGVSPGESPVVIGGKTSLCLLTVPQVGIPLQAHSQVYGGLATAGFSCLLKKVSPNNSVARSDLHRGPLDGAIRH